MIFFFRKSLEICVLWTEISDLIFYIILQLYLAMLMGFPNCFCMNDSESELVIMQNPTKKKNCDIFLMKEMDSSFWRS